jgi:hypothetical protein
MDRSDVVAAINELAGQGCVERTPDPDDRRRNRVSLTTAGRRQPRRMDRALDEVQDDLLGPLSAEDRQTLARLLTRLLTHHQRAQIHFRTDLRVFKSRYVGTGTGSARTTDEFRLAASSTARLPHALSEGRALLTGTHDEQWPPSCLEARFLAHFKKGRRPPRPPRSSGRFVHRGLRIGRLTGRRKASIANLVIVRQAVAVCGRSRSAAMAVAGDSAWRSLIDFSYSRRARDSSIICRIGAAPSAVQRRTMAWISRRSAGMSDSCGVRSVTPA